MKKNVVIITNFPVAYRVDFFNELLKDDDLIFSYIFISEKHSEHKKKISSFYNEPFLKNSKFINANGIKTSYKLFIELKNIKADIIIVGGFPIYFTSTILYKLLFRAKVLVWWAGTDLSEKFVSKTKTLFRKVLSKFLDGAIYYSKLSKDNLVKINNNIRNEFILGNNTRDARKFYKQVQGQHVKKDKDIIYLLTIGFQFKFKNTILILNALEKIKTKGIIYLYVLGDGPALKTLRAFTEGKKLNVIFIGEVSQKNILYYYKLADVFVHPSLLDRWPQTYNEAICSGLPVLISSTSGVCDPLTEKYKSNIIFNPNNLNEFVEKLTLIIEDSDLRKKIGKEAQNIAFLNDGVSKAKEIITFLNKLI